MTMLVSPFYHVTKFDNFVTHPTLSSLPPGRSKLGHFTDSRFAMQFLSAITFLWLLAL